MRILQGDSIVEKKGGCSTGVDRRLRYLSMIELATHSRKIARKYRFERASHAQQKRKVAQLKIFKPLLKELEGTNDASHDVLRFCTNIMHTQRTNAFGWKVVQDRHKTSTQTKI